MNRKHTGMSVFAVHYFLADPRAPDTKFKKEVEASCPDEAAKVLRGMAGAVLIKKVQFLRPAQLETA